MYQLPVSRLLLVGALLAPAWIPGTAAAQAPAASQAGPFQMPTVTVTAQKEPADPRTLPVSVTAVPREMLDGAGIGLVRDAAAFDRRYVPVAFAFDPGLAPSGFLGETGAPRTFGLSAGVTF